MAQNSRKASLTRSGNHPVSATDSWQWARSRSIPDLKSMVTPYAPVYGDTPSLANLVYQLEMQEHNGNEEEGEEEHWEIPVRSTPDGATKDDSEGPYSRDSSPLLENTSESSEGELFGATSEPLQMGLAARPPARAPPKKGATVEVYGFVCWIASFFLFGMYMIWALLPEYLLHELGISYYPNKWWVLALPSYTVPLVVMMWCTYVSINLLNTDPLASKNLYTPDRPPTAAEGRGFSRKEKDGAIEHISDMPLTLVNELLYHRVVRASDPLELASSSMPQDLGLRRPLR